MDIQDIETQEIVTQDMLNYYKEKFDGHKIIYARFSNNEFIFRTLTKKEYRYVKSLADSRYDLNDKICDVACLYPQDTIFEATFFAGVPDFIAPIIEEESGFTNIEKIMDCYYEEKNNLTLEKQCMDMIKAFIPEYTYEEMEDWTWEKLMRTTARAERVAKLKGFDFALNDKTKEMEEEFNQMNSDNKEFIDNLYKHGIDPMFHFQSEIEFKKDILDFPLIIGTSYDNEVVLDAVRKQITKKNTNIK